jgi:hypothetical protein
MAVLKPKKRSARVSERGTVTFAPRLAELVERIAACQGGDAYFSRVELTAWPGELVQALQSLKLLMPATPATSLECPGCEEACMMPVEVEHSATPQDSRALIFCETRDDISRVEVPLRRLERLKSSGEWLAIALAKLLDMAHARPALLESKGWQLGSFQGNKHKSPLVLSFHLEPRLEIAGHTVRLVEVLGFRNGAMTLDRPALRRLVDNPSGGAAKAEETPEQRGAQICARLDELKAQGVKAYREQVAKEEGVTPGRITQIVKLHRQREAAKKEAAKQPADWRSGLGNRSAPIQTKPKRTQ